MILHCHEAAAPSDARPIRATNAFALNPSTPDTLAASRAAAATSPADALWPQVKTCSAYIKQGTATQSAMGLICVWFDVHSKCLFH